MSPGPDSTILLCLFHHDEQAQAALNDLTNLGYAREAITVLRGAGADGESRLIELGIPQRDIEHLQGGLESGGTILSIVAKENDTESVETIFGKHRATKIDQVDRAETPEVAAASPVALATGETMIPIVEEELAIGKRTVDQGGVRVYRKVVEIPVEESVQLRDEHVVVQRVTVNRAATAADYTMGQQAVELTETAEEAVVIKNARVVEEVLVGKKVGEHTQHIQDSVRRTEIKIEELAPTQGTIAPVSKERNGQTE